MIHETRAISVEGDAIQLDPFAFWPDLRSRLVGMGGPDHGDDPDYAFHTLYVASGTGPIVFTVAFDGLKAERGTLIMRVHELPEIMGAHARQVAIAQTQLVDLIRGDGTTSLAAMARSGSSYALLGHIYGDTEASAESVMVEIARRSPDPYDPAQPTRFRGDASRIGTAPRIIATREGTLITPVSQLCTANQMREPVLAAVIEQMDGVGPAPLDRWEQVYLARVLDRYDVARSGARGLGIGALSNGHYDPIAAWLAAIGCVLTLTSRESPTASALPSNIDAIQLNPSAIEGPAGFDFAWATRQGGVASEDRQAVLRFVEDVLRTVKPGGLAIIVLSIDVAPHRIGDDDGPVIRRPDIDRIVVVLLSRGHQVAQVCPWGDAVATANTDETVMLSAFGLIVRRAA